MKRNEKTTRKENNIDVDNTPLSPTSKITKCLKEFEGNFISKINEQAKNAKRDLNMKSNHLTLLEKRLNKKANELDVREGQLNLAQQELEIKSIELLKQLQYKDEEIDYIKDKSKKEKEDWLKEKDSLNKRITSQNKRIEELEKQIQLYKEKPPSNSNVNDIKDKDYEDLLKENSNLKILLLDQNKIIKKLKLTISQNELEFYKKKEEIYIKRIEELERFNRKLLRNSNCSGTLDSITEGNQSRQIPKKEHKVFTFKTERNFYKNKSSSNLLYEKEVLIKNGNYSKNDPLILKIDEKLRRRGESNQK